MATKKKQDEEVEKLDDFNIDEKSAEAKELMDGADFFKKVKIKVLSGAKYHKPGTIIEGSEVLARKMVKNGTGELVK